jgi:D-xylose 1-dehydrogenase (NADP+, D-xylono-1,5-lactone-forming)
VHRVIRWGLLSPARIGEVVLAGAAAKARSGRFVAVASRDAGRADAFAAGHGLQPFGSYEALLDSDAVDAIYVALPNGLHMEWATRALEARKHVLCEKPLSPRPDEVAAAFDVAERTGRVLAEAFMWRYHPSTRLAQRLVADGAIGELAYLKGTLSFTLEGPDVRLERALDGGSLLDLGCYCVAAARLFAGEPDRVYAEQRTAGHDVDVQMAGTLRCGGVLAQFDCGFNLPRRDRLELVGRTGELHLPDPWVCRQPALTLLRDGRREEIPVAGGLAFDATEGYGLEIEEISAALLAGEPLPFGREDGVGQARALAALLRSAETGTAVELEPAAA